MPTQQEITKVKESLEKMLEELDKNIINVIEKENQWGFIVEHGEFKVILLHLKNLRFMISIFQVDFPDNVIEKLTQLSEHKKVWRQFNLDLRSALSSPLTAYKIEENENDIPVRFKVHYKFFPFHKNFSIKNLHEAIQSVVSVGKLGMNYLWALFSSEEPPTETTRETILEDLYK